MTKLSDNRLLSLPKAKRRNLEGSRIFVEPLYAPAIVGAQLDLLPLLIDRVIVCEPTRNNLKKWNYLPSRFLELVQDGVFVPLYVEEPKDSDTSSYLTRKEVLNDFEFFVQYEDAVEDDLEDREFLRLARLQGRDPNEIAFNVNWDLIVSQAIGAPILTTRKLNALWEYKLSKFINTLDQPTTVKQYDVLEKFLFRALGKLPKELTVEQMLQFRKEKRVVQFRNWLTLQLQEAMESKHILNVTVDENLFKNFSDLVDEYASRTTTVSTTLTGIVSILTALAVPQSALLATLPAITGPFIFPRLIRSMWKQIGPNNWVFLMLSAGHKKI